jgi:hypothetical protein
MNATDLRSRHLMMVLIAVPFVTFGAYVAWLVAPVVIREVVHEVVRIVKTI